MNIIYTAKLTFQLDSDTPQESITRTLTLPESSYPYLKSTFLKLISDEQLQFKIPYDKFLFEIINEERIA